MERFYIERHAIMDRMPKKKPQKQSDEALLSEVKNEMAQPRAAKSTRSEPSNQDDPQIVQRDAKEKAMKNRWLAFLIVMIAVISLLFVHGQWGGTYVERHKNSFFESGAREALNTISAAAVSYSAEHGKFPATLADMGPQGDKLLDDPLSAGAIMGYTLAYQFLGRWKRLPTNGRPADQIRTQLLHRSNQGPPGRKRCARP